MSEEQEQTAPDSDADFKPDSPGDLAKPTWFYVLRKTVAEFIDDQCTDLAAALTYYSVLALFPGSRRNELRHMLPLHVEAARALRAHRPETVFALGLAPSLERAEVQARLLALWPDAPVAVLEGRSRELLLAADVALAKPGSVTMEAALLGCPLVVAGRAHPFTAALWRRLSHVPTFAMPNWISGEDLVPEFLQGNARPERIASALVALLEGPARERQLAGFEGVRKQLGDDVAAERAAAIADEMLA